MVATLVGLRLRLLRNSLRKETWRLVLSILGVLYGLGMLLVLVAVASVARSAPLADRAGVVIGIGCLLTLGWAIVPLVAFGVDDSLDPQRFALFTVPSPRLALGLALAGAISLPGVFTALALLATTPVWSTDRLAVAGWLVGAGLGLATCLLLARTTTTAAAAQLRSRRGRDIVGVIGMVVLLPLGLVPALSQGFALGDVLGSVRPALDVLAWSPLGAGWALASDLAGGHWLIAGLRLLVAAGWLGLLFWWWSRLLHRAMDSQQPVVVAARKERAGGYALPERVQRALHLPLPAAAVAARALRYWRSDPRYLASAAAMLLIGPMMLVAFGAMGGVFGGGGLSSATLLAVPAIFAGFAGWSLHNDVAYDSTALWLHVSTGTAGRHDRLGRTVAALSWMVPVTLLLVLAACALTGRWEALPAVLGASVGLLGTGLGVAMYASALVAYPVQPPGTSPFASSGMGSVGVTLLAQGATSVVTVVLALPVVVLAFLGVLLAPVWGWAALGVGFLGGGLVLALGVRLGGDALDARAPRHLQSMRGWSGH